MVLRLDVHAVVRTPAERDGLDALPRGSRMRRLSVPRTARSGASIPM